ncbi:lipoprotein [gut metagenome]|uniref:Lipoprotein n=1 Tax=gut metagenome TaxID=749906 RepID=J9F2H8_9ZZZZ
MKHNPIFSKGLPRETAPHYLRKISFFALMMVTFSLLAACANPGSGPDGGPYDETPPKIVNMTPMLGQSSVQPKRVTIEFNELVKLENATEKVVVSPPQIEMPDIKVSGHRISVHLLDSLKANTTYTIDFSDAIEDNNEGNPMGQFTYYFSTGSQLDTMEVAGHVLDASNLEPIKGILVGLHKDTTDTAFTSLPFERVARTNGNGEFTIKGIAPGKYRIYALKDMDGDFKMSRGEMYAFSNDIIVPTSFPDSRNDTLWRDTIYYDTIHTVNFTHFLPDNIILKAFDEKRTERYLLKTQRDEPEWFRVYFTAPSAHVPTIKGLNFDEREAFLEERNPTNDTITYWLRDFQHFPQVDTLEMAYTFEMYDDSTQQNIFRTDTLTLVPRHTLAKRLEQQQKDLEKWEKKREKRHKKGDYSEETPPMEFLKTNYFKAGVISPEENVHFQFAEPLNRMDSAAIRLLLKKDSLLIESPYLLEEDSFKLAAYTLKAEWRPGQTYEIHIDSGRVEGISGKVNRHMQENLTIPKMESYGALFLLLPDADSTAVVQLMPNDKTVNKQLPIKDGRIDFFYLKPGSYYLRMFYDRNQNGYWDPGVFEKHQQAEEVFYFPVPIAIKANWDVEQTWRVNDLPLTQQKPKELIRQKENKKKTPRNRNAEREQQKRRR